MLVKDKLFSFRLKATTPYKLNKRAQKDLSNFSID
jgi:hypothetical protein